MEFGIIDITVFITFIVGVVTLGLWKSRASANKPGGDSAADYFLAGRGLSWWLIGISLIAANISAEQFVGMSGQGADFGLATASWEWIAAVTLIIVAFCFLPYFLRAGIYTIPQFLEVRYSPTTRTIMAVFVMFILVAVSLSAVIYAGALAMRDLVELYGVRLELHIACWIMGGMAALYVAVGGLKACAWADLIQGSALILGGAIIAWFAFHALDITPLAQLTAATGADTSMLTDSSSVIEKFKALNSPKLHMLLPKDHPELPWTALLFAIWIPNLYYWGLNQYITQRLLGSASLREGQKGLVFAAGLKLIIPFLIVFPGVIAFNLYSGSMAQKATEDFLKNYEAAAQTETGTTVYICNEAWAAQPENAVKVAEIAAYNQRIKQTAAAEKVTEAKQAAYKTDSALGLLIGNLIKPGNGLLGFVLAALFGAIISSLAAVLNAASTIFTMDIYDKYIDKGAPHKRLVTVGRICIVVFVIFGCLVSPALDKLGGIFKYIQEMQGFVTPGILAVFVFGLINRRAHGIAASVGLLLNPVLYGLLMWQVPAEKLAFTNRMAVCFIAIMVVMTIIGAIKKFDKPVVFATNTTIDVTPSKGAQIAGIVVVILTALLYYIFR